MNLKNLSEAQKEQKIIQRAKVYKWRHIELRISDYRGIQDELRLAGVLKLIGYSDEMQGKGGMVWEIKGGVLIFRFDEDTSTFNAFMFDDLHIPEEHAGLKPDIKKLGSILDEPGYNRNFLASHYASGRIEIMDKEVEKDVKRRAKLIEELHRERQDNPMAEEEINTDNICMEELEAQELIIKKKKEALLNKSKPTPTEDKKPKKAAFRGSLVSVE